MPFSKTTRTRTQEYWDNHYKNFLKPLIESCNIKASRSEPLRQNILRQIINDLVFSPIVVADLTDGNPNVYWELGVRQSFCHGTITILDEASKKIPFDVSGKGILRYSAMDSKKKKAFSNLLTKAIKDCLNNPKRPDSEVLETITGRTSVYATIHHEEIKQRVEGLLFENHKNFALFTNIIQRVIKNKEKKGLLTKTEKMVTLTHLSSSAVELLLTERYVEEDPEFYDLVHTMHMVVSAINQNINTWNIASDSVEDYFLGKRAFLDLKFQLYEKKLLEVRDKLRLNC
jgi:hypothetical protein